MAELGTFEVHETAWGSVFQLVFVDEKPLDYGKGRSGYRSSGINHVVQKRIHRFLESSEKVRNPLATHPDFRGCGRLHDVVDEPFLVRSDVYWVVVSFEHDGIFAGVVLPFYHSAGYFRIVVRRFVRGSVGSEIHVPECLLV